MSLKSEYITVRIDAELKDEISKAAQLERRTLSNMGKLLLEYGWGRYLAAGSMRELLDSTSAADYRREQRTFPWIWELLLFPQCTDDGARVNPREPGMDGSCRRCIGVVAPSQEPDCRQAS